MEVLQEKRWLFIPLMLLLACVPPGKGRKAKAKYKEAQPLIDALEVYHRKTQGYPEDVKQLVPEYLPAVSNPFDYQKTETGYTLHFSYAGPGMNQCTYEPATRWRCRGYF
jgi:hypothetical protein